MDNEEFLIKRFLESIPYGVGDNNLLNLFRFYTDNNIKKADDIQPTISQFKHILSLTADYLKFPCEQSKQLFGTDMHRLFSHLKGFSSDLSTSYKEYLHIVKTLMPTKEGGHLLDVGCGKVAPLGSIELSKSIDKVSAMDKHLLSPTTINKLGVNGIYGYFNKQSDVSNYDFVTGRAPCGAIDSIVDVCSKNNTPYFIRTCNCQLPADQYWQDILPEIDPNIQFYGDYAFNADASVEQVQNITSNFYTPNPTNHTFVDLLSYFIDKTQLQSSDNISIPPVQE